MRQTSIKRKNSFELGKEKLFELRGELMAIYDYIFSPCSNDDFIKMPPSTGWCILSISYKANTNNIIKDMSYET